MPYRHVVEITDDQFDNLEKRIRFMCKSQGYVLPPNLTHIALTELFKDFVNQMVVSDTLSEFIYEGGLDDVLERTNEDEE